MLEQILKQIQQGGAASLPAMARQLKVSEALVEQMLAELTRLGYLRLLEPCNQGACTRCPQHSDCSTRRPAKTWTIVKEITTASVND